MNNYEQVLPTATTTSGRSDISNIIFMIAIFVVIFLLVWLLVQFYLAR